MKQKDFASAFLKICLGVTLTLFSAGFVIFSLQYNTVKAAPPDALSKKINTTDDNYVPVGIEIKNNTVYLYGYDKSKMLPSEQIIILAQKRFQH